MGRATGTITTPASERELALADKLIHDLVDLGVLTAIADPETDELYYPMPANWAPQGARTRQGVQAWVAACRSALAAIFSPRSLRPTGQHRRPRSRRLPGPFLPRD